MDAAVAGYVLAGLSGIAGVGVVGDRVRGLIRRAGGGGSTTPNPDDDSSPRIPWWLGGPGPVLLGVAVAEITLALIAPETRGAVDAVTPILIGFVGGAATKTVLNAAGGK